MDDSGDNKNTLVWILGGLVLVAAVAALIIAVSAKNSTVDEDQVVEDAKTELKSELAGLGGAIKASKEASKAAGRQAARDNRRIRRQVGLAVADGETRLNRLSARVKELQADTSSLQKQISSLKKQVANQGAGQEQLEAEVTRLGKKVARLEG
jgi:peptidoglycan hydrolase CwlO-like protein